MGNPLSATLSELYKQHFESHHITHKSNPHYDEIKLYTRYVNDLFFIQKLNTCLYKINHILNIIKTVFIYISEKINTLK